MVTIQEVLYYIKSQLQTNQNGYGEPQAWIYLKEKGRSIEIVHEEVGLSQDEEFYSLSLYCSEEEFDNDDFHSTVGVVENYCTGTISDEQLIAGISYLMNVNLIS